VNFAQGAFAMVGAYLYYRATGDRGWSPALAWAVAIGVPAALAVATQVLVMSRLRRASALVRVVATLSVFFLAIAVAGRIWGDQGTPVRSPLPTTTRSLFGEGTAVSEDRLWLVVVAVVVTAALAALFRWTRFGHATDAAAENPVAAAALGYSPDRIAIVNWALGGALAAVAGVLVAPILFLSVGALAFTVLRGLAAALVGSFRSFWWTLGGAFGIGVIESTLSRYIEDKGLFAPVVTPDGLLLGKFTSASVYRSVAFLMIVVVMVIGGRSLPLRSALLDRLPAVGTGKVSAIGLALATAGAVAVLFLAPEEWALALLISMGTAIVCLSLVVVTGFVGQLSLAQMALAGFGAWAAGRLATSFGWPFLPAVVAGALAAVPAGALVALPALRTRGINLAVLTFGLSVLISEMVLGNTALTGGFDGTRPDPPSIVGIEIDALNHPDRYGFVVLVALVLAGLAVANLRRGRAGLRLLAVRGNERAAASLGVSVPAAKLYGFSIGAGIAGLGGSLLAFRSVNVSYLGFTGFASIQIVVVAVIGGIGYVIGPLFAGPLAVGGIGARITDTFGFDPSTLELVSGVLLVVILFANPNGLADSNVRSLRRLRGRRRHPPPAPAPPALAATGIDLEGRRLAVRDLTVRFGGVVALDAVELDVRPGEVLGLIGPNGAGKTTFIDAVTGFVDVAPGSVVTLGDASIAGWSPTRRARAGLGRSFQSLELFEDVTVRENLLVASDDGAAARYGIDLVHPGRPALSAVAVAAVREFGLQDDLDSFPTELPHGRRRLVAIARAVAASPAVLLLDEPAAGLAAVETEELGRLVRWLAHDVGLAVLMIEHDVNLVLSTCDRVAVLDFGRRIALGTPAEIARDPAVVSAYLGAPA
jgi:ABC-type branched-subunit amino acid transport system ATPase component/ABC-type branched-subunit amino acid transport system permease subunit